MKSIIKELKAEKRIITPRQELAQQHLITILSKYLTSSRAKAETIGFQVSTVEKKLEALKDIYYNFKQRPPF